MFEATPTRSQFDDAIENLTATLVDLFTREVEHLRAEFEAQAREQQAEPAPPERTKPRQRPQKKVNAGAKRPAPLVARPNVHVVPAAPKPEPAPSPIMESEPVESGPSPEEIAHKAVRFVLSSSLPPTFERIRRALRVRKTALEPVIQRLVAENKVREVGLGDVVLYEPPRIEPIRRRRVDRQATT